MESNTASEITASSVPRGCINCNHPIIEEGYPNRLCASCRQNFIKFPIPLWIKLFGGAILVVLLFSMVSLPQTIYVGVEFAKGKKALDKHNYVTAQKGFEIVSKKEKKYIEGKGYLMMAAFYNQDFQTFGEMYKELEGTKIENEDLYNELGLLLNKAVLYYPSDSLSALFKKYNDNFNSIPDEALNEFLDKYPEDIYAKTSYASRLIDKKQNEVADSILTLILNKEPDYFSGLMIKASLKREIKQYDSAHFYCDRILKINNEFVYGISSKARIYLKQKSYNEGLKLALKAHQIERDNPYNLATLAIAYHLTKNNKERDKILKETEKDSAYIDYMSFAKDVINGKEKFID